MRSLCTSLGSWDTIETKHKHRHGITFPLAILSATMVDAGYPEPDVWEGDTRPDPPPGGWDVLLISAMDPRHHWRVGPWLTLMGLDPWASERGQSDPIVILGGQAATAPAPIEALVDVVYVGEAEAHAADVMGHIDRGRAAGLAKESILERIAEVPGCLVPMVQGHGHPVSQVYAEDVGITLRERLSINQRKIHRIEIARGCRQKCGFCVLGWRSKYRENPAEQIRETIRQSVAAGVREVHLSAGDAESHSEIVELRRATSELGVRDYGWTGRLDTVNDCSVSAGKYFAFGLEGASHRLRRLSGKAKLSHEYVVQQMARYYAAGGRIAMWHLIGGLPGETDRDAEELGRLLDDVSRVAPSGAVLHVGRQPFGPLPHTPMQWFAPGLRTERLGRQVKARLRGTLRLVDKHGQRLGKALANAVVMRGGWEVTPAIADGPPRLASEADYYRWCEGNGLDGESYIEEWSTDRPLPWDHVTSAYAKRHLVAAHSKIRRLAQS